MSRHHVFARLDSQNAPQRSASEKESPGCFSRRKEETDKPCRSCHNSRGRSNRTGKCWVVDFRRLAQPRNGERMQPTASALGGRAKTSRAPEGRKKPD